MAYHPHVPFNLMQMPPIPPMPPALDPTAQLYIRLGMIENELWHTKSEAHSAHEANRYLLKSLRTNEPTHQAERLPSHHEDAEVTSGTHNDTQDAILRQKLERTQNECRDLRAELHALKSGQARRAAESRTGSGCDDWGDEHFPTLPDEIIDWGGHSRADDYKRNNAASGTAAASFVRRKAYDVQDDGAWAADKPLRNIYEGLVPIARQDENQGLVSRKIQHRAESGSPGPTVTADEARATWTPQQIAARPSLQHPNYATRAQEGESRAQQSQQFWKQYAEDEHTKFNLSSRRPYKDIDAIEIAMQDPPQARVLDYGEDAPKERVFDAVAAKRANEELAKTVQDSARDATFTRKPPTYDRKTLNLLEGRDSPTLKVEWKDICLPMDTPSVQSPIELDKLQPCLAPMVLSAANGDESDAPEQIAEHPLSPVNSAHAAVKTQHATLIPRTPSATQVPDPYGRALVSYSDLEDDETDAEDDPPTCIRQASDVNAGHDTEPASPDVKELVGDLHADDEKPHEQHHGSEGSITDDEEEGEIKNSRFVSQAVAVPLSPVLKPISRRHDALSGLVEGLIAKHTTGTEAGTTTSSLGSARVDRDMPPRQNVWRGSSYSEHARFPLLPHEEVPRTDSIPDQGVAVDARMSSLPKQADVELDY